ncbi:uncharacterized protein FOMMEDRAFT_166802 [Fomitiporia mediterranea MF3/22]|uniref:uncharacterized protein n=1 Tax=Fomitiporia mediterranea (strain MF3/22) TaxID=694068 RepID=UPI00044072AA|nr:uncharacterized protein FOMMEDRAFT_166802 [Fomitiporia mediterranea MF3/22]EJD05145.1 hypothetical protein FOMMEDRAFT_166802 [Fomitiporia mediterranea MF3/22]
MDVTGDMNLTMIRTMTSSARSLLDNPTLSFPGSPETLQQIAQDQQSVKYVVVASFVVMLYDNLLTLSKYFSLFWGPRRSRGSALFFITRWPVLLESLLYLIYSLDFKSSEPVCKMEAYLTAWGALVFLIPLQVVIILRTIALWERTRSIIFVLFTTAMATDVALLVLLTHLSISLDYMVDPLFAPFLGCESGLISFNPKATIPCYIALIAFDTMIFSLTLYRALRTIRRTHLVTILVRDGFFYYSVMLAISVSAVTVSSVLPFERSSLIAMFSPIIKASFCIVGSRISLNLREAMRSTEERLGRARGCDFDSDH